MDVPGGIRMIALDIDGTLLTPDKRLTERSSSALERALDAGIVVVPASGRSLTTLPRPLLENPRIRYAVSCNGAAVTDLREGRRIHERLIPYALLREILNEAKAYDCVREAALDDVLYIGAADDEKELDFVPEWLRWFLRAERTVTPDLDALAEAKAAGAEKILLFFTLLEEREAFRARLERAFGVSVAASHPYDLEINAPGVSKASALRALAAHLGIPMAQVMACGDSENDAEMLRAAGLGVAMGNAAACVRAAAKAVTASNEADGAALAIERWALGETTVNT